MDKQNRFGPTHVDKPIEADKGIYMGACNRRACQQRPADWFNPNMAHAGPDKAHYCRPCAILLNNSNNGQQYWKPCIEGSHENYGKPASSI